MPLRLAGEEYPITLGIDGRGWLRNTEANDVDPALKVDQQGSGKVVDFRDGGGSALEVLDGREVTITLGDAAGAKKLLIKDSGGAIVATIDSDGKARFGDAIAPTNALELAGSATLTSGSHLTIRAAVFSDFNLQIMNFMRFLSDSGVIKASMDTGGKLRIGGDTSNPVDTLDIVNGDVSLVTSGRGIACIPDATAGAATVDDLTKKRLRLVKRATAPTSAYIAFTNNPGTDTFYLIAEDV